MNAERLHVIASAVRTEIEQQRLVQDLQQLVESLKNQVNQPQQPNYQQAVSQKLKEIYDHLAKAPSDSFSPAWKQVLKEIGGELLLGSNLASRIRTIFERNQITPATALQEIQGIQQQVTQFKSAIDQVCIAFPLLNISKQDLKPGECEIGVLVPRVYVDNRLDEFGDELREINFMLSTFAELVTTRRDSFQIRSIPSTDLSVYLEMMPQVAACLAFAMDRLIYAYKSLLEIRKLHADLKKQGIPEENLKGVEQHANELMNKNIEKLLTEIVERYCKAKGDRLNELKNGLRITLNKLANRIDRGFNIEIRVQPLPASRKKATKESSSQASDIATIQEKARTLEFIKIEGEPILSLPESENAKGSPRGSKKG